MRTWRSTKTTMRISSTELLAFFKALSLSVVIILIGFFVVIATVNYFRATEHDGKGAYYDYSGQRVEEKPLALFCEPWRGRSWQVCRLASFLGWDYGVRLLIFGWVPLLILTPIFYYKFKKKISDK